MKREHFLSMVVADTFFVSDSKNIRIDHFIADCGFYIIWEFAGRTNSRYIEKENIGEIAVEMKKWYREDNEAVKGWLNTYKECCNLEKQYKKAGF